MYVGVGICRPREVDVNKKLGQLFVVGIKGTSVNQDEAQFIINNNIGGVVLFGRNIESPEQVHALCSQVQALRHRMSEKVPLFIGIDMEGGRIQRLKTPFTQWPSLKTLNKINSTSVAFKFAMGMAKEMTAVGINLNFAPCIDVLSNPHNQVIGDRSLSDNPEQVAKMSSALVRGYIKGGILPCAKHFPGHGSTDIDSHEDLPIDSTDAQILRERDMVPFKKAFRARLDCVMTAHIKFSGLDPEYPVTLSKIFLKDILRFEMRYRGIVITDDLDMKALTKHYKPDSIPVMAVNAGADILLYCNDPDSPQIALEALVRACTSKEVDLLAISNSTKRILDLKRKITSLDPIPLNVMKSIVGCAENQSLAEAIQSGKIDPRPEV